ncbi:probable G-protein coupled receptor 139 [Amblyraja radiata]|uniref:probable G-protein coupled receptor 139 n=1 Tax=Amblyraja radiata TaxID=386614 RepID=UPI0014021CDC|nr:probable G-protein coupled receptor 139 [Amblyraja radiata]
MSRLLHLSVEYYYYPVLASIGVPVNLLAIVVLSRGKCGLSKCITRYLVAMATADLTVIVCEVIINRIAVLYWWNTILYYTPVCRCILFLSAAAVDCSVWFTVAFTFDRFVAISKENLRSRYCTDRIAAVVMVTLCTFFCLQNVPWPFAYNSFHRQNGLLWGCRIRSDLYFLPAWIAFSWSEPLLTPVIPFCLILLFNAHTARRILMANRVRRRLRDLSRGDPETESRKRSIILLFAISSSFILLWVTTISHFVYYRCVNGFWVRGFTNTYAKFEKIGVLLQLLNTCTNTLIYTVTQGKFREQLLHALQWPVALTGKFVQNVKSFFK